MSHKNLKLSQLVYLLLFQFMLFQSSVLSSSIKLQPLQVIGKSESIRKIPGSASIISSKFVNQTKPVDTNELLRSVSGISVRQEEGLGLRPNISIRGIYGNRTTKVLLLEDGIPIALAPYGESSAYYSPQVDRIETIEVLKGSGSILYGPQTVGGVINYITPTATSDPEVKLNVTTGSHQLQNINLTLNGLYEDKGITAQLMHKKGDGPRDNSPYQIADISAKLTLPLSYASQLNTKIHYYNETSASTYTGLTSSLFNNKPGHNPALYDRLYVERLGITAGHHYESDRGFDVATTVYGYYTKRHWWRQDYDRADYTDGATNTDSDLKDSTGTAYERVSYVGSSPSNDGSAIFWKNSNGGRNRDYRVAGIEPRVKWGQFEGGTRLHFETENNRRVNGTSKDARTGTIKSDEKRSTLATALFGLYRLPVSDKTTITPGLRIEAYDQTRHIYSSSNTIKGNTGWSIEFIPGIGVTHDVSKKVNLFAGVHRGFAPPKFADSVDSTGTDVKLDAERSLNYEAGIRYAPKQWLSTNVTAFFYDYDNQVISSSESGSVTKANSGKSVSQGIELDVQFRQSSWLSFGTLFGHSAITLIDSRFKDTSRQDKWIPYVPGQTVSVGLGIETKRGQTISAEAIYNGSMFSDESNTESASIDGRSGKIEDFYIVNLQASSPITSSLQGFVAIKNALNRSYIASRSPKGIFPGASRQFQIGFTGRF